MGRRKKARSHGRKGSASLGPPVDTRGPVPGETLSERGTREGWSGPGLDFLFSVHGAAGGDPSRDPGAGGPRALDIPAGEPAGEGLERKVYRLPLDEEEQTWCTENEL